MKKSKYTESQIAFVLKQAETGISVEEVCRKTGISEATFYNWKKKYGGLGVSELRKLHQLEEENAKLKQIVADLSLDKQMLQDVLKKKVLRSTQKRMAVEVLYEDYRVSIRRICSLIDFPRSMYYYKSRGKDNRALISRMRDIAMSRVRYGFRRIYVLLRREGWFVNHKRVYRLYCQEGLNLRMKRHKKSRAGDQRMERTEIKGINEYWSMDFVSDLLFNGKKFRALTIVDNYSRKCLAIKVGQSMKGTDVVNTLEKIHHNRGIIPKRIQVDNGPEFISKELDRWAWENKVTLDFSRPGRPTDNPFIESFNGSFRDECLNTNWFLSLQDAEDKIESYIREYNEFRPHSSLQDRTPQEVENEYILRNKIIDFSNNEWS
ncbi:MAG: IS3 family transposase [Bacteroidales bacterium]|nr:IS3 family transposase [Bacteroidales bacterium]